MVALHEVADVLAYLLTVLIKKLWLKDVGEQAVRIVLINKLLSY